MTNAVQCKLQCQDICKHMMRELRGEFQAEQKPTFRCKCSKKRPGHLILLHPMACPMLASAHRRITAFTQVWYLILHKSKGSKKKLSHYLPKGSWTGNKTWRYTDGVCQCVPIQSWCWGGRACQQMPKIYNSMDDVLALTLHTAFEFKVVLGGCFRTVHEVIEIQLFEQHSCPLHLLRLSFSLIFSHCGWAYTVYRKIASQFWEDRLKTCQCLYKQFEVSTLG